MIRNKVKLLNFKYGNVKRQVNVSKKNKALYMTYAKQWISNEMDWQSVIFTDEIRFSCDGPVIFKSFMPEKTFKIRYRRQMRGGSVMYFGMLFSTGDLFMNKVSKKMKSSHYKEIMRDFAVPKIQKEFGKIISYSKIIFQFTFPERCKNISILRIYQH